MQQTPVLTITDLAAGTILANTFVGMFTGLTAAAGAKALGVARFDAATGQNYAVDVLGTAKVLAGAAVAKSAAVKSDAAGKAIPQDGTGEILGYAREAATAANQLIEILLTV